MRFVILAFVLTVLISCKKKQREGNYTGTEDLLITTSNDTVTSTFNQSISVEYQANGKVEYTSSTFSYVVDRKDKNKDGYHNVSGTTTFTMVFKDDSLVATYFKDWLGEQTTRTFKGSK